jgi:hypothetical protein
MSGFFSQEQLARVLPSAFCLLPSAFCLLFQGDDLMKAANLLKVFAWCFALMAVNPSFAEGLITFSNGEIADADEINNNFSVLNSRLNNVENMNFGFVGDNIQAYKLLQVDCSENAAALSQAWEANYATNQIKFVINGRCEWPYPDVGFSGKSVIISGAAEAAECPAVLPSIEATSLGISYGGLWLQCVKFESNTFIAAYANGYIRLENITKTTSDQTITVWIRNNSTLRVFGAIQLNDVRAEGGSHVNLRPYAAPSIESLQLLASSTLWCNGCSGDISLLKLRDGSDASFTPAGSGLNVTTLDAAQGARISVNAVNGDMVIAKEILTENAIVYRRSE